MTIDLNLLIVLALLVLLPVAVIVLDRKGFHPFRAWIHHRQRQLFSGKWRPPEHSKFWDWFPPLAGFWVIASAIWLVIQPRSGWAILNVLFAPMVFVSIVLTRNLYIHWDATTPKIKVGSWRPRRTKERESATIRDILHVKRRPEDAKAPVPVEAWIPVEILQTDGLSPEGQGFTTANKGPIIIASVMPKTADAKGNMRAGWDFGEQYFVPAEPIPFLRGYGDAKAPDPDNPTPLCIMELVDRHAVAGHLRVRPNTLILVALDLYPDISGLDLKPGGIPQSLWLFYDQSKRIADLVEQKVRRGMEDQVIRTSQEADRGFELPPSE
jgi:hypothetical protein